MTLSPPVAALAALVLSFTAGSVYAETRIVTALIADGAGEGDPDFVVGNNVPYHLSFTLPDMPGGARIRSAELRLVRVRDDEGQGGQERLGAVLPNAGADGTDVVFGASPVQAGPGEAETLEAGEAALTRLPTEDGAPIVLELQRNTDSLSPPRRWYGPNAALAKHRPRLILTYSDLARDGAAATVGQAGALGPRPLLPEPLPDAEGWMTATVMQTGLVVTAAPVSHGGLVFALVSEDAEGKTQRRRLVALDPPRAAPVWSKPVEGAGPDLVVTPQGEILVLGDGAIRAFTLQDDPRIAPEDGATVAPTAALRAPALVIAPPTDAKTQNGAPPIAGPDGSLYVVTSKAIVGISPNRRELWSVRFEEGVNRAGPLTLGPSGRFLYTLTDIGTLAIDAQTGQTKAIAHEFSGGETSPSALFAPVVFDARKDASALPSEIVVSVADLKQSGALRVFDNQVTLDEDATGSSRIWTFVERPSSRRDGLWGQPLPGRAGNVVYILSAPDVDGCGGETGLSPVRLQELDPLASRTAEPAPVGVEVCYRPNEDQPFVPVVVDADGVAYALGVTRSAPGESRSTAQLLVGRGRSASAPPSTLAGLSATSRLIFGTDGTLLAVDRETGELAVLVPQVALSGSADQRIGSPTHLRLTGVGGANLKAAAAGAVLLAPGISLAPGTTIRAGQRDGAAGR